MRKVFLSTVSMLSHLKEYEYSSEEYKESSPTAFPITILLENNCQAGDRVCLLTIVTESSGVNAAEKNYADLCGKVAALAQAKNFTVDYVRIPIADRTDSSSHQKLYKALLGELKDGDEIHADITYGFKSTPIVLFAALNQAYQLNPDVEIAEIMYGSLYNGTDNLQPELFDLSSLFYLNSLSGVLGSLDNDSAVKSKIMALLMK